MPIDTSDALLRRHGLNVTAQRLAVLRAVADQQHSTADDIYTAVRGELGAVSRQAVYDALATFTEKGVLLKSGRELEADIVVTATGLNVQMLGGMHLSVDGEAREVHERMTYKAVLVQDIPNMACVFGYANAPWTLKSDIAGAYLCRLFKHMDDNGYTVATPRDVEGCATDDIVFGQLQSGYVQRAKDYMPRQGSKLPWKGGDPTTWPVTRTAAASKPGFSVMRAP